MGINQLTLSIGRINVHKDLNYVVLTTDRSTALATVPFSNVKSSRNTPEAN